MEVQIRGHTDSHSEQHPCSVVLVSFDWAAPPERKEQICLNDLRYPSRLRTWVVQPYAYLNTLVAFGRDFKRELQRELVELLVEFWVPSIVKLGCDRRN